MASRTRCALLLLLAALIVAPVAAAAEIHPSVFPSELRGKGPWDVTYLVEFDSGPADERVALWVTSSWVLPPAPVLTGPGQLTAGPAGANIADRFCAGGNGTFAMWSGQAQWLLDLPANTVNTLAFTIRVNHRFNVRDTRLTDLRISTAAAPAGYDINTQRPLAYTPLPIADPELLTPRDAGISLAAAGRRFVTIKPGERVAIRGKTSPLIAGQRVDLRAAYDPEAPYALSKIKTAVASVRVRDDGSFGTNWRAPKTGRWTFAAFYDSHDPRFLDSEVASCYPIVQVG